MPVVPCRRCGCTRWGCSRWSPSQMCWACWWTKFSTAGTVMAAGCWYWLQWPTHFSFTSISAAIQNWPVQPVLSWGLRCPKTSRHRFLPQTFPVFGAAGISAFPPGCRITFLCRWLGLIPKSSPSAGCVVCRRKSAYLLFSSFPAFGMGIRCRLWFGVCCRRFTAWGKKFCTARSASLKRKRRPGCSGPNAPVCLFFGR